MVEVFKTNVNEKDHANMLIDQIHKNFIDYKANFDLEDCDKVLRVNCKGGSIQAGFLINLLKDFGFSAEVLPDTAPSPEKRLLRNIVED
ncbi:MAG: hypothetical protein ABI760_11595 [Ferruginibacter sp.]